MCQRVIRPSRERRTYVSASNLERGHDSVTLLQVLDARTQLVDNTAELVSKDIPFLKLNDGAVEQVQVTTADGASGNLQDNIAVLEELRLGALNWGSSSQGEGHSASWRGR